MERMKCKHCGAEYEVALFRVENNEPKEESCRACGNHLWSCDSTTLPVFTLIEERAP
jgi:formate dehydrogenase maturation protein FdhE